jgi:DNA-binding protein Fis
MAFKLSKSDTFTAEVEISTPDEKGRTVKESVKATYKRLNGDELDELKDLDNREVLRRVLVNVDGLRDDDNQPVPWNEEIREGFLLHPPAVFACAAKFWVLSRAGRDK